MRMLSFRPSLTFRGRERRGLRGYAGKPFHPPLTDIPVAAYLFAAVLDLISIVGSEQPWAREFYRAASFTLIGGAALSVLAALTGFMDWLTTEKGSQIRRTANAHAWTMITVTLVVLANISLRWFTEWDAASTPAHVFALSAVGALLVSLGSMIGGSLVYDYGFNVETASDHPVWHPSEADYLPEHKKSA
jgi:uncharacterized membrane protein